MKSWTCTICEKPVAEFAAHVKLSSTKYAHLKCHNDQVAGRAVEDYRNQEILLKAQTIVAMAREAEAKARETFDRLARCHRCGVKCTTEPDLIERLRPHGEVRVLSSSTPGVCAQCVREEARARQTAVQTSSTPTSAAQAIQQAPSAPPKQAEQEKTDGPKKDRAALLEIE